eukprot:2347437-Amphidinium_carterae.1
MCMNSLCIVLNSVPQDYRARPPSVDSKICSALQTDFGNVLLPMGADATDGAQATATVPPGQSPPPTPPPAQHVPAAGRGETALAMARLPQVHKQSVTASLALAFGSNSTAWIVQGCVYMPRRISVVSVGHNNVELCLGIRLLKKRYPQNLADLTLALAVPVFAIHDAARHHNLRGHVGSNVHNIATTLNSKAVVGVVAALMRAAERVLQEVLNGTSNAAIFTVCKSGRHCSVFAHWVLMEYLAVIASAQDIVIDGYHACQAQWDRTCKPGEPRGPFLWDRGSILRFWF